MSDMAAASAALVGIMKWVQAMMKYQEQLKLVKSSEKIEDEPIFSCNLTDDQLSQIEDEAFSKMQTRMSEIIQDAIAKANMLLKIATPQNSKEPQLDQV